MDLEQMKSTIRSLHAELAAETEIDQELKELLSSLDDDIHQLMEPTAPPADGLLDRAETLAARFAAAHPRLESAMQEIIAALAKMGV